MPKNEVIMRFEDVLFERGPHKPILDGVSFSVRRGAKLTLMGQNGAGKSTLCHLITGELRPDRGKVIVEEGLTVALARQVMPLEFLDLTIMEFFERSFSEKIYDIEPRINSALEVVNFSTKPDRRVRDCSGGQQARLLLAAALITDPDILLLDEPTNNLDKAGIEHLTKFIIGYANTCIVISHDADFLNAFTQGVLYLDIYTHHLENYVGNYFDVVAQITVRIEKENSQNARLEKEALAKKEKANFFANKGGRLRLLAKRMREKAEELEEEQVDVRKEDKTIRSFTIHADIGVSGELMRLTSFSIMKNHKVITKKADITLRRNEHLLLIGPNGIGKSTLLESLARGSAKGARIAAGVRVGYYRQDFSTLKQEETVYQTLASATDEVDEEKLRSVAAGFLINSEAIKAKIGSLSEGQKGLVSLARLVLEKPGLLILDEPTNHMNFRHLPVIAAALNAYTGGMILVSHVPEFVRQIRIDRTLDLEA
jgi:ATPase subunit of ABC transporter with duplicated ATPase domains